MLFRSHPQMENEVNSGPDMGNRKQCYGPNIIIELQKQTDRGDLDDESPRHIFDPLEDHGMNTGASGDLLGSVVKSESNNSNSPSSTGHVPGSTKNVLAQLV